MNDDRIGLVLEGLAQVQDNLGMLTKSQGDMRVDMATGFGDLGKMVAVDREHITQLQDIVEDIKGDLKPVKTEQEAFRRDYVSRKDVRVWAAGAAAVVTFGLSVAKYLGVL